jgi:predicted RNase H-like nuclease
MDSVPNYLGLDGFRFGWVAAWIDERGGHGFDYSPGLTRLLAMPHVRAMIDMPIGLKPSGYRACDLRARELVGPAVFLGARRDLWTFPDMAAANRHYWEQEGKGRGVSAQTIGEAHPELIFWHLAGGVRLDSKASARGREQRIALLSQRGFTRLPKWLTQRHGTGIGRDDLIDACACAVAARDSTRCIGGGEIDPRGLRMEINY